MKRRVKRTRTASQQFVIAEDELPRNAVSADSIAPWWVNFELLISTYLGQDQVAVDSKFMTRSLALVQRGALREALRIFGGVVPVRFYRGRANKPTSNTLSHDAPELSQMGIAFKGAETPY